MLELNENEFAPYQKPYLKILGNTNKGLVQNLEDTLEEAVQLFKNLSKEKQIYSYAEGKWTIKEVIQHIIDSERVFVYRAMRFARKDKTQLPGFEQDDYVINANSNAREFKDLLDEFMVTRKSSIALFKSFDDTVLKQLGTASGYSQSVRALGYMISGHQQHHINIIKERYL